ncbi:MAG TPA: winged helix-turn-helix domain-containing protein [Candidatus Deferrimicrobium sp.]|nr:winged helix-turn-helix domain-containing protein [Candidatus Deferrimicrobium sp.]
MHLGKKNSFVSGEIYPATLPLFEPVTNINLEDVFQSKGRVKILKLLASEGELNISNIARRTNLNHTSTRNHLYFLEQANILEKKVFGRIRIYRFRSEDSKVRAIKHLFDLWEPLHLK